MTTLLLAIPGAFDALRYLGVAYLIYLGIKAWRSNATPIDVSEGELPLTLSLRALFRGGFAIGISNPKLILFAAAFFPQFVDPGHPKPPQFALLVATFAVLESFWYAVYALGGRSLAGYLERPAVKRAFNRVTGVIFVGFGLALLRTRHS